MNKTLHKKLTEKHAYSYQPGNSGEGHGKSRLSAGENIMQDIASDLMQPRPEAVAFIMKMSRNL